MVPAPAANQHQLEKILAAGGKPVDSAGGERNT
jgi:hypothetical protein